LSQFFTYANRQRNIIQQEEENILTRLNVPKPLLFVNIFLRALRVLRGSIYSASFLCRAFFLPRSLKVAKKILFSRIIPTQNFFSEQKAIALAFEEEFSSHNTPAR